MEIPAPLTPDALYHRCDPADLKFDTTAALQGLEETFGQARALNAIHFGVGVRHEGYNLYVLGSMGLGKHTIVRRELERRAAQGPVPHDWVYVNDFDDPHRPRALALPAGMGRALRHDMDELVDDLTHAIPAAFESDEYRTRLQEINDDLRSRQDDAFSKLSETARGKGITILRTPAGYTIAPIRNDEIIGPEEFEKLPKDEQTRIEQDVNELQDGLKETIRQFPRWQRETRSQIKALDREVSESAVAASFADLVGRYADHPEVLDYLHAVNEDVLDNIDEFRHAQEAPESSERQQQVDFTRYKVNVLVDNDDASGAPVVYEDNPTYMNLIGRVEHLAHFGALLTNFTLIKPGALHRANGGYLIIDAHRVLGNAFAWEALKRALRSREIRIESLERMLSLVSTITLEPEPIPLDLKVVIAGDRLLYYLLKEYDPEFSILFKVAADFSEDLARDAESHQLYARVIAGMQQRESLRPFERDAVARIIEQSARRADDGEKLSLHLGSLQDLLREANYWAGENGAAQVRAEDVERAVTEQIHRQDQMRERMHESVLRDIRMIDSTGAKVGQANGLSVIQLGDYAFGLPSRITATARLGEGSVIDIEREVKLGGAIHSKGVLILSSYLASRYAADRPLPLSASLVFEQSYGHVEGDSASVAELCTLMSALGEIPLQQGLAVTGSVNQHGEVQAIGGVNEKIEGFFDICQARGLTGEQGVIIPGANLPHLMLRQDVIDAVDAGRFRVYAARDVEQVMALLSGMPAGERDAQGRYPEDSFNGRIQHRIQQLVELRKRFAVHGKSGGKHDAESD
jgi:lon-related putative ATP-dependent protease